MKSYQIFVGKLILIILCPAVLGWLLTQRIWGAFLGAALPVVLYFAHLYLGKFIRNQKLKRAGGAPLLKTADGFSFRDLNKNGRLDVYEDSRQPIERRVEDLLQQMTVEEKAGLLFSPQMDVVPAEKIATKGGFTFGGDAVKMLWNRHINTFACMGSMPPREFARWHNALQRAAENTRLGIPVTLCSDPRHVYVKQSNPLSIQKDEGLSAWPSSPGLGATRDETLMEQYGRISAAELRAVGIRFELSPAADTATEPRWPRVCETFGEDAQLNGRLAAAYVRGMQGETIGPDSVACCVKHFPGGGPQKDGNDPHFAFGKEQVYPGKQFDYHLSAFQTVIGAGVAAVMPYYGVPMGLDGVDEVGFNFNKAITHDLLREKIGFQGLVHSDYSIIEGLKVFGLTCIPGRAWGLEKTSTGERLIRVLDAGVDQIGGESCAKKLAKLVRKGKISEERLDVSCRRVLELKFRLGLFDAPYVDEDKAEAECHKAEYVQAADDAMRRSLVLLKNEAGGNRVLPLPLGKRVYVEGFSKRQIEPYATAVDTVSEADYAIVWMDVPQYSDNRDPMASLFQMGDLNYPCEQLRQLEEIMAVCPAIVVLRMTRPSVIPEIKERAAGILAEFNVKPEIILEAVFGKFSPSGKLPYDLPYSMEDVRRQNSDQPFDCEKATYRYGHGLSYESQDRMEL